MTQRNLRIAAASLAMLVTWHAREVAGQEKPVEATIDKRVTFELHIAPIFQARCIKCHGEGKLEAGLDLRRKFLISKGGDSGPALVTGKLDESLLYSRIDKGEMPPKEEGPFDDKQKDLIRRWIVAGAPLAGDSEKPLDEAEPPNRVSAEDRAFWSFVPPVRPPLPQVINNTRARAPIDLFLLRRLEEKSLSFAPDAPKEVLLRRATFALHGLPPTPNERDEFLADERPDCFERLLDRLLASPRYGEHAARQWLDVAGYADSDGYLAADRARPEAWRYRDYVVRAFNSDVPYDRFVLEQLAGDELSGWRKAEELTPEMERQLAATGFLRTCSDPTYPGYNEPNEIHQVLADTLQIVSTTFLGLTVHCARCHSHKFDPLPQRDYYALQAVFAPALDPARWQPSETRGIPLATEAEQARIAKHNSNVDRRVGELQTELNDTTARYRKKRVAELLGSQGTDTALVEKLLAALLAAPDKRNAEQKEVIGRHAAQVSLAENDLAAWNSDFRDQVAKLKAAVVSETALKQKLVLVRGLSDLGDQGVPAKLLVRGDYNKPGAAIEPNVPEVLTASGYEFRPTPGYKTTGRREALARWLVDPANPLTARVQVNRVWARHFGRGLVPTVANFGRSGVKPTHPELLDWLADEFKSNGWGQKQLHRELLLSTAWRQASTPESATIAADPRNELLGFWRAQRHTGEMLRDSALATAAKLNERLYGAPAGILAQADGSITTANDAAGNRRSLYLVVRRSQHITMLDLFDVPMMEVNCPQRASSIVPLQALAMLHGPFAEQSAASLANRLLREAPASDEARVEHAWRLLFCREVKPAEKQATLDFVSAILREKLGEVEVANVLRGVPEPKITEALRTAWTQAALVLLNSNEFLYVH